MGFRAAACGSMHCAIAVQPVAEVKRNVFRPHGRKVRPHDRMLFLEGNAVFAAWAPSRALGRHRSHGNSKASLARDASDLRAQSAVDTKMEQLQHIAPASDGLGSVLEGEEPCSISRNKALLLRGHARRRRSMHRLVDFLSDILGAVFDVLGAIIDCGANLFNWAFRLVSEKIAADKAGRREGKNAKRDGQVCHGESFDVAAPLRLWVHETNCGEAHARGHRCTLGWSRS